MATATLDPGARYTLFSDGSTHWVCDISSSSDDDAWIGFFRCFNALGTVLFDQGGYNFNIAEEDVVKRWDEFRGPDPRLARAFNEAEGLQFHCRC
ncbi:DUF6294 family protein [Kibdelosporangium aridum]|uniref:DUF6294 family protein n=1 Tax=Kibdelosporangium aridum TaxID=2030 RepID=UPI0035ED56D9